MLPDKALFDQGSAPNRFTSFKFESSVFCVGIHEKALGRNPEEKVNSKKL